MNKKVNTSLVASLLLTTNLLSYDELSSITVTSATKSEQSIKDVTSNIDVITKEEIEDRQFTTVTEALNSIPSISVTSNGGLGSSSSIYLRGMGTEKTLVLIDGVRYQDPSNTSGANFSHLMINDIERIEVIKGAQSGIWGADASAGVINIITKKAKKGTHGSVNLEAGSFDTKKYAASISHGTEKFDIKFNASKLKTDGFTSQVPDGKNVDDFEKDAYENRTISINTNYYIDDKNKLSLDIKDIDATAEYDGGPFGDTAEQKANNDTFKSDIDTTLYKFGYSRKIDNHNIKIKYELSKFKRHEKGTTSGVLKFSGKTQNIEINDEYKYLDNSFLVFGLGANKDDVDYIKADRTTNEKDSKGKYLYLTNSNNIDKLIFTQSLRYDSYNNFDNELTGKVGVKYNVNSDLSLSSNIGSAYNVPSIIYQLNPWGTANDELEPEKTKSFDIGFTYNGFTATYFRSKVDNLIEWSGGGFKNVEGESNFKGVELSYKKEVLSDTLLSLGYIKLNAEDENSEKLTRRAARTFKFGVDYFGFEDFHFNVNGEYIGDRRESDGTQTGRYTLWNSVINYKINKKFSTYLKVDNIFDKEYQTVKGYATASRSAYLGIKYSF